VEGQSKEGAATAAPSGVSVRDWRGNAITIGTRCIFGSPLPTDDMSLYRCQVTAISESETTFHEDEYGHNVANGETVALTLKFDNGDEETATARLTSYDADGGIFEADDDLEVSP